MSNCHLSLRISSQATHTRNTRGDRANPLHGHKSRKSEQSSGSNIHKGGLTATNLAHAGIDQGICVHTSIVSKHVLRSQSSHLIIVVIIIIVTIIIIVIIIIGGESHIISDNSSVDHISFVDANLMAVAKDTTDHNHTCAEHGQCADTGRTLYSFSSAAKERNFRQSMIKLIMHAVSNSAGDPHIAAPPNPTYASYISQYIPCTLEVRRGELSWCGMN